MAHATSVQDLADSLGVAPDVVLAVGRALGLPLLTGRSGVIPEGRREELLAGVIEHVGHMKEDEDDLEVG